MPRKIIVFAAAPLMLFAASCSGGFHSSAPSSGEVISAQQESARAESRVPMTQRAAEQSAEAAMEARTRAQLKPGTRIYYIETITVGDGGHVQSFPASSTITKTESAVIVTPPKGIAVTFGPHAQIIYLPRGGEAFVPPGRPVPAFLRDRTPNEITH